MTNTMEDDEKKPLLRSPASDRGSIQSPASDAPSSKHTVVSAGGYSTYDLYGDPEHPEKKAWFISRASFSYLFPLLWVNLNSFDLFSHCFDCRLERI
jgi:hypothetical protein